MKKKYTQEDMLEFATVTTQGAYGDYRGCKSLESKLQRFNELKKIKKCSICKEKLTGYGNNAEPINSGVCCDHCNVLVIHERLRQMYLLNGFR